MAFNFINAEQTPSNTLKIVVQAIIVYGWRDRWYLVIKEAHCCVASVHSNLPNDNLQDQNSLSA